MPHLGAQWPDEQGLALVEQWILGMNGAAKAPDAQLEAEVREELLASPKSAMQLARRLGRSELSPAERDVVLTVAAALPNGPIRDLFEGYLPAGESGQGALGSNPRPATILAVAGDAGRGEELFWSEAIHCGKCHRVGERGTPIGPDLSAIGRDRSKEELLESLLSPSRRIDPKYAAYLVRTGNGRSLMGLVLRRVESFVTLRDSEGKEVVMAAEDVEEVRPLRTSLMPDGQMAGLTAQEAADLVEYLATRQGESSINIGSTLESPQPD
jgi:putative heme-binding domain-containing protein